MFGIMLEIISIFFTIYGLYYVVTGIFAFFKPLKEEVENKKLHRFSIIIAARNEEGVIGNLIESLKKQNYDKEYYDINVIVNNSTDDTYKISKKSGANAIKCEVPVSSKGEVLRYVFKKFKDKDFDAYIVFDADNVVHPEFLNEMNKSLNKGYKVAQGFRDSKNYQDNWISGSYALFYYIQNFFFNLARKKLKASASINGTGFMVEKKFIESIDFNPVTLTEDVELTTVCAIKNEKIDFVNKAITYDEQPTSFKVSFVQRLRWSKGSLQCWGHYHHQLIKSFFKNHNLACIDMYMNNLAVIIQVMSYIILLVGFIEKIVTEQVIFTAVGILAFIFSYISTVIVTLFVAIYNKKSISAMASSLILFTLFIMTWFPINIVSIVKRNVKWNHIGHNRSVDIDEVMNSN